MVTLEQCAKQRSKMDILFFSISIGNIRIHRLTYGLPQLVIFYHLNNKKLFHKANTKANCVNYAANNLIKKYILLDIFTKV